MPTLFNRPPRKHYEISNEDLVSFIEECKNIAISKQITLEHVIRSAEILEQRRSNKLYVANADAHDEQLESFGEILQNISLSLSQLVEKNNN